MIDSVSPRELRVELGARAYPILIGTGLLNDAQYFGDKQRPRRLITDQNVAPHYLQTCLSTLGMQAVDA
jgi:3-dehydroquinate synthase